MQPQEARSFFPRNFAEFRLALVSRPIILVMVLAGQFSIVQILMGAQFGDAPRNMHWGILTFEQPNFLLDGLDTYERIKGFPPDPASLGPRGEWNNEYAGLHRWWGPALPLLFAAVWAISRSQMALQLVIPLVAAGVVLLTYRFTLRYTNQRAALIAAAFLACYPLFREYSSVAYSESFSALVLTAALYTYLRGRTVLTLALGTVAALSKMDLIFLYCGVVGICMLADRIRRERYLPLVHHLVALCGPLLLASPWIWFHYLHAGSSSPTEPFSAGLFLIIFPMMIELTFYAPWFISLLTFSAIGLVVAMGLRHRTLPPLPTIALISWFGLGLFVTLLYCATPGAGNNPRIIIPALPALAILFGAGWPQLAVYWRRRLGAYLIALFVTVNLAVIGYNWYVYGQPVRNVQPAFAELREREPGFVLTPLYWETILNTRQPATWFESDPTFQANIMGDIANFTHYIETYPIRYVLLPDNDPASAAPEVRRFLEANAESFASHSWTLYILPK
ncbi:MAG: glycosyl transferase [Oscillochloris sp.]|nr:glycosyl transferase [Oscillochloris sp.]